MALAAAPAGAGAAADIGFSGPSFSGASAPTGQKPQSKLWYHDGFWWGVLFNAATSDFEIYRLDGGGWRPTGTLVDGRTRASADVLWNGSRLYVASAGPNATDANHAVRVSRLRYDAGTRTWAQDIAPVSLTGGGVEAVVLDRDKTARVWVTYTSGGRVFVAHTTTGDGTWAPPYVLPVKGAGTLTSDDISTLVAYDGRIGVLWSNQNEESVYFASHRDGDGTAVWSVQTALSGPKYADDHLNIKSLEADSSGRVFAAVKASMNDVGGTASSAPLTLLLVLGGAGSWQRHTFGTVGDDHTRPLVLLQPDARRLHMLAASPCCSGGAIYLKSTSLDKIAFAPGLGTPFLRSDTDANINHIASTKQTLTNATGLVAIAGDDRTKRYWTSVLALGADTTPPQTAIDSGPSGTTSSTSASFSFSASETGSIFACSTDGGAAAPCTSPATLSGLAAGTHTFSVRATDGAGNTDPTPAQRTWTVDPAAAVRRRLRVRRPALVDYGGHRGAGCRDSRLRARPQRRVRRAAVVDERDRLLRVRAPLTRRAAADADRRARRPGGGAGRQRRQRPAAAVVRRVGRADRFRVPSERSGRQGLHRAFRHERTDRRAARTGHVEAHRGQRRDRGHGSEHHRGSRRRPGGLPHGHRESRDVGRGCAADR